MLLRTSSAPLLHLPSFSPTSDLPHAASPSSSASLNLPPPPPPPHPASSLHRHSSAEFHLVSSSSSSSSSSSASPPLPPSAHHRNASSAECHAVFASSSSSDRASSSRPPILHRAQSEGDIASAFCVSMNAGESDDVHRPRKLPISAPNAPNLGFLSLGGGLSGSGHGGNGSHSRPTAEEGSHGFSDDQTDAYYHSVLRKDPNNPLFLGNYAQLLAERGDLKRSEECYERAILADPHDGEILSQYAKLQWTAHKDERRAEMYYDRAVQAAPDDCYVMASYASFLWDVEEEIDADEAPAPMALSGGGSGLFAAA